MSIAVGSGPRDPQGDLVALAESIGEGVALCCAGEVCWANSRLAEILGRCSAQALTGESFSDFFENAGSGLPADGGWRVVDCRVRGACEGSPLVRLVRVEFGESGLQTLWVVSPEAALPPDPPGTPDDDLRERFSLEARKSKELLDFMGHELRAPLTVIQGYNRLMLSSAEFDLDQKQRRFLDEIGRNCSKMGELLERLEHDNALGLSPCTSVHLETACLEETIQNALRRVKPVLAEAKLEVDLQLDPRTLRFLFDPSRIEQVFVNLLENTARYASPGSVEISSAGVDRNRECFVEISVSDSGPGIPAGDRERIFDSGVRLDDRNNLPGSGLGLYISRQIVCAHGGDMTVVDSAGGGSCFVLTLPLVASEPA